MEIFWNCKTTSNSEYYKKIRYLSEPSIDLIEHFKQEIVTYDEISKHEDYVPCSHVEKSKNHMLFILGSRVEILIRPDCDDKKLYFMDCNDIGVL